MVQLSAYVAGELRAELARQRRSQVWLAGQADQSVFYLSRRLSGEHAMSLDDAERYAQALDIPIERLIARRPRSAAGS